MDSDAAVYIRVFEAMSFELRYDFVRFARHLLNHPAFDRREIERTAAQYNHLLLSVKPLTECQYNFEGLSANHDYIDAGIEFLEAVRLLLTGAQEIKRVVWSSKKTIDAHSTED